MENTPKKIACIGAGNLTKGLLYPLFTGHGLDVTIVALTSRSCESLKHGYAIQEIGEHVTRREYDDIRICRLEDMADSDFEQFDCITTAVGVSNFQRIAAKLRTSSFSPEVPLILCENDITCFDMMRFASPNMLMAIVDRIVYYDLDNSINAESYFSFEISRKTTLPLPDFISRTADFGKSYTKKKYLVNALHAIIAWHGYSRGHAFINSALRDGAVRELARAAARELTAILVRKYPQADCKEFTDFAELSFERFSKAKLDDPIRRVGRNVLAKLGKNERLMEPVCYAREHGLAHSALLQGASYGLLYHAEVEQDNQSPQYETLMSYIEDIGGGA